MSQGPPAVAVSHKGRTTIKPKLSLTTRVANNSQKKIETLNRSVHTICCPFVFFSAAMELMNIDDTRLAVNQ